MSFSVEAASVWLPHRACLQPAYRKRPRRLSSSLVSPGFYSESSQSSLGVCSQPPNDAGNTPKRRHSKKRRVTCLPLVLSFETPVSPGERLLREIPLNAVMTIIHFLEIPSVLRLCRALGRSSFFSCWVKGSCRIRPFVSARECFIRRDNRPPSHRRRWKLEDIERVIAQYPRLKWHVMPTVDSIVYLERTLGLLKISPNMCLDIRLPKYAVKRMSIEPMEIPCSSTHQLSLRFPGPTPRSSKQNSVIPDGHFLLHQAPSVLRIVGNIKSLKVLHKDPETAVHTLELIRTNDLLGCDISDTILTKCQCLTLLSCGSFAGYCMPKLKYLHCVCTTVNLAIFKELPSLEHLVVDRCLVSGGGDACFPKTLRRLTLVKQNIHIPAGITHLDLLRSSSFYSCASPELVTKISISCPTISPVEMYIFCNLRVLHVHCVPTMTGTEFGKHVLIYIDKWAKLEQCHVNFSKLETIVSWTPRGFSVTGKGLKAPVVTDSVAVVCGTLTLLAIRQ